MGDNEQRDEIRHIVEQALQKAERVLRSYRRRDSTLIIAGLLGSTLGALLAGGMAAGGPDLANQIGGRRLGCSLIAIFSAIAAITSGIHKHFKTSEHLGLALSCVSQLSGLKFSLDVQQIDAREVAGQYRKLLEKYAYYVT